MRELLLFSGQKSSRTHALNWRPFGKCWQGKNARIPVGKIDRFIITQPDSGKDLVLWMSMLNCYNCGCGQLFDPEANNEEACTFHPGEPVFHDVYKQWSCCKKRTRDFTDFLNIKGCTKGPHNPNRPEKPKKPRSPKLEQDEVITYEAPAAKPAAAAPRPPTAEELKVVPLSVAESLRNLWNRWQAKADGNGIAGDGARKKLVCQNAGCGQLQEEASSECLYHPGVPVFHEGLKYWSCCQKGTTDFGNFLKQSGCTRGSHNYDQTNKPNLSVCRYDWFQTGEAVTVNIYARAALVEKCRISLSSVHLKAEIAFDYGEKFFDLDVPLWGEVDVAASSAVLNASKVEIQLRKANPGAWASLTYQ
uniref:CS domain-containing protein n=1 Tax=Trichuris muris TaxID=70415 RepID=A0A5S6QDN0_TRIMR